MTLTDSDKQYLLELARSSIARKFDPSRPLPSGIPENVREKAGVFVTLKINGELRGCIGEILPMRPLYKAVEERAQDAAFGDPRFYPLTEAEFVHTDLEISVLTPPFPVSSWKEIEIGKHGILLTKGRKGAVFLPQVPVEENWDIATTLTHLALKAGMGPDDWRENAQFQLFEAIVFGEREDNHVSE